MVTAHHRLGKERGLGRAGVLWVQVPMPWKYECLGNAYSVNTVMPGDLARV